MKQENYVEKIKKMSKQDLVSELMLTHAKAAQLEKEFRCLKERSSKTAALTIKYMAQLIEESEKAECLYAIDKSLFK